LRLVEADQRRVLDTLNDLRAVLAASEWMNSHVDTGRRVLQWFDEIEAAVLGRVDPDQVAQAGDYLGLMRGLDWIVRAQFEHEAAIVDGAWEGWYRRAHADHNS
jgi:hypothetical protein